MRDRIDAARIDALDAAARGAATLHAWNISDRLGRAADRVAGDMRDDRGTFLGFRVRTLVAMVVATVAISVAAIPYMPVPCGTVVENGTRMAASCSSEDELVGRMSAIHAERSGRTWEGSR
jgi:hypothetical protein